MPACCSSRPLRRVSSQHTRAAARIASIARGDRSPRLPIGVLTRTSRPARGPALGQPAAAISAATGAQRCGRWCARRPARTSAVALRGARRRNGAPRPRHRRTCPTARTRRPTASITDARPGARAARCGDGPSVVRADDDAVGVEVGHVDARSACPRCAPSGTAAGRTRPATPSRPSSPRRRSRLDCSHLRRGEDPPVRHQPRHGPELCTTTVATITSRECGDHRVPTSGSASTSRSSPAVAVGKYPDGNSTLVRGSGGEHPDRPVAHGARPRRRARRSTGC